MQERSSLLALNRGIVSRYALARVDLKRMALAAEEQENWIPRVLGPASLRPGFGYVLEVLDDLPCKYLKFIFATDDTALLELTDEQMRVLIDDVVLTRPTVTAAVANGSFTTDVASWTDNDEAGAVSSWVSPGYLQLVGATDTRAIRDQTVTCNEVSVEHALRVVIARGPVTMSVGSTVGGDDYVKETGLETGEHSLAFTPTGNFSIRFSSTELRVVWVNSCTIEAAGEVLLPTPWTDDDLANVRYDQSGDVIFVACVGMRQRRIERRGTGRSWSVAQYLSPDGPFDIENTTSKTLTPSAQTGNITVTASRAHFKSTHVGALFSISSEGQVATVTTATSSVATSSIRVTGVSDDRTFSVVVTGDNTASTVNVQRSYDNATWVNIGGTGTITADASMAFIDGLDNQVIFYRMILTTRVAPDTVTMEIRIGAGSVRGIVRVTGYTSSTVVSAEVIKELGGTTASDTWQEGLWSDLKGWPSAVRFNEGRLWWAGQDRIWGSVSDAFDSFDEIFAGDAGPINRTIGSGPVDTINWLLNLQRLVIGGQGAEHSARSTSLDEPLTPTNFNVKAPSSQGSGAVAAVKVDQSGFFVNRSGVKVFELAFDVKTYDFATNSTMELCPELGLPGIVNIDVQRLPDTRLHCVRSDGTVAMLITNKAEDTTCWITVTTDGEVEDVVTLPALDGDLDDQVYYVVKRTIGGATKRYLEKWAQESDCRGDADLCFLADSYISYSGVATTSITGLDHLEGEEVVVWADGDDVGTDDSATTWTQTYTVSGGAITLATAASNVVVGLGYEARFKSTKLGSINQAGSPLNRMKNVGEIGLILADVHPKGLRFGPDFDDLDDLPSIEDGTDVPAGTRAAYDEDPVPFPGTWTSDSRICLLATAPRPCTVMAVTPDLESH